MEQPNPQTPVEPTQTEVANNEVAQPEVVASQSNASVEDSPLDETHYVDANSTRDSLNEEQNLNDSLDKSVTLQQVDEDKSLEKDRTLEEDKESSDKSSGKSLGSEPWVKIDEDEANMTSQSKENDKEQAKDEQAVQEDPSLTESSINDISEAKFGVLNSTLTSQWSQSVEEKAEEQQPVEEKESKVSTPESEPCDSPRSSIEDEKVEENMEEAQVTEENAEASSYEVLQSLTRSEMGMSLKSLPESPMKTQDSAKNEESPAKTSEAEQTADAEQKEAATSDKKEECAGTSAESKPAEVEKPKEPEDLDVLGNGMIMKKVLVGSKKEKPTKYSFVTVVVSCEKLDIENEEMKFVLADEEVCQALDLSVQMMDINEKAQITSDANYCVHALDKKKLEYKEGEKVVYTVELTKCEPGPYSSATDVSLKLDWANSKKLQGNNYYSKQLFGQSAKIYSKVVGVLKLAMSQEISEKEMTDCKQLSVKCLNNAAACHIKTEQWSKCVQSCAEAESIQESGNIKTLLRKGKALAKLGKEKDAISVLNKALKLDPEAKDVQNELQRTVKKLEASNRKQKEMYGRMFGGTSKDKRESTTTTATTSESSWFTTTNIIAGSSVVAVAACLYGIFYYQKINS